MGMVVRSNIMAVNANRQLGMNNSQVTKSLEKLASGFKINRAGDDASGLAISEKMKAQIKGLETASANSQDGISLIQTAEGALTEVHSMLNRMVELAGKSANGTIQDDVDRDNIQNEVNALISEIDRIGDSTNFNGINLIDGNLSANGSTSTASTVKTSLATSKVPAIKGSYTSTALTGGATDGQKSSFTVSLDNGKSYTVELAVKDDGTGAGKFVDANGKEYGAVADTTGATATETADAIIAALKDSALGKDFDISVDGDDAIVLTAKTAGTGAPKVTAFGETNNGTSAAQNIDAAKLTAAVDEKRDIVAASIKEYTGAAGGTAEDSVFTINGQKFAWAKTGTDVSGLAKDVTVLVGDTADAADNLSVIAQKTGLTVESDGAAGLRLSAGTSTSGTGGLTLQVGDTADKFNQVTVSVDDMRSKGLGVAGLDVSSQESAKTAIATIKEGINKVSTNRGNLGALQNRLEYTINNLDVTAENMSAANSRVRDTDMAKQMMDYTKMNVLNQAAQAMLAQANQQPQSILQLLQ